MATKHQAENNSSSSPRATSSAKTMADLMRSVKTPFVRLQKGEVLKGKITKLTPSEILVDINAKTEAVVLEKDKRILRNLLNAFKEGDEVNVSVLNPESDLGNPVVSLRRHIDAILWQALEEKRKAREPLTAIVRETIRGGLLVDSDMGISGFLPNSQITTASEQIENGDAKLLTAGKKIKVYLIELNRDTRKVIFSQRPVINEEEFNALIRDVKTGQKLSAIINSITSFGIFVTIPISSGNSEKKSVDGLIHISEVAWEKVEDLGDTKKVGEAIEAVVIGVDKEAKRIDLSLKRLEKDPFEEASKLFMVDQPVSGIVKQVQSFGVLVNLDTKSSEFGQIEGLIRKEKIPPTVVYKEGDAVTATVSQIDIKRRRIILVPIMLRKTIGYR